MNTTETAKFFLIITFACLFLAAPGACADQLPNLDHDLQQLEQWRLEQHQRLKSEGGTTAQHQAVDREYLNRARALEAKRTKVLDELGKKAGVGSVKQGAHGTDPMQGRGAAGDIDTKSYTPSEYDRLLKHAKKMYGENNIEVRGDSFTIKGKGLNTTVHRAPTKFKSPAGSTAGEMEAGKGLDPESSRTVGAKKTPGTPSVKVQDNLAKGGHTLTKPTSQMSSADYQELGKMTLRNLDEAGINDPVLRKQAEMLKKGYRPESAGIKDTDAFQKKAAQVNMEAAQKTTAASQAYETELTKKIDAAVKQGKTAEAVKLRQELAEHRQLGSAAKKNLAAKQPELAKKTAAAKPGAAKKTAAAKTAGDYVKGAVILGRADKIREGIKEGDPEKTLGAVVGEDTAARVQVPEGDAYVQELEALGDAQEREIESELAAKLRRMGATREEADLYIEARRGGDTETRMEIVEQVRERGGVDPDPGRGLAVDTVDESSWHLGDQLVDGAKQAGEYGGVVVDVASMGGLSRGRQAQDDLDDVVDQAAYVRDQTEASVNQQLYMGIRERGGTAEEAAAYIEARERGDAESRREILAGIQDRGDWRQPEQTRGLRPLDNIDDFQEDESWLQRYADGIADTAEGLKETLVDTPIKVITETGSELIEIGTGLTEEGVTRELIQERDPRVHREIERQAEESLEDGRQSLIDRLTELGASEVGAKRAADALINDGDVTVLRELVENVRKIQEMKTRDEMDDEPLAEKGDTDTAEKEKDAADDKAMEDKVALEDGDRPDGEELDKPEMQDDRTAEADRERRPSPDEPDTPIEEAIETDVEQVVEAEPETLDPEPVVEGPRPSEHDMPGLWETEGTRPEYDVGHKIIDDAGTEFRKTADGSWEETGDRYDPITREQKEQWDREIEEAACLQGAEPQAGDYAPTQPGRRDDEGNLLDIYSDQRDRERQQQVDEAFDLGQHQQDMQEASAAGDRLNRDARNIREAGERDASMIAEEAARNAARQQQEDSWSQILGDAVENGLKAGGQALGSGFGKEAGKKVAESIFDSDKPRRDHKTEKPKKQSADKKPVTTTGGDSTEAVTTTKQSAVTKETSPVESGDEAAGKESPEKTQPEVAQPAPTAEQPPTTTQPTTPPPRTQPTTPASGEQWVRKTYDCGHHWMGRAPAPTKCPKCSQEQTIQKPAWRCLSGDPNCTENAPCAACYLNR